MFKVFDSSICDESRAPQNPVSFHYTNFNLKVKAGTCLGFGDESFNLTFNAAQYIENYY